jgi:hypothetical protein
MSSSVFLALFHSTLSKPYFFRSQQAVYLQFPFKIQLGKHKTIPHIKGVLHIGWPRKENGIK